MVKKCRTRKLPQDLPGVVGKPPAKKLFMDGTYDLEYFHKVFIEEEDVTEYKPAIKLVGTWAEWERIKSYWPGFGDYVTAWKAELEVKLKSDALEKIRTFAKGDDQKALIASKFFATKDYNREMGRGRASKKEIAKEAKELARAAGETKNEKQRIEEVLRAAHTAEGEMIQ